MTQRIGVLTLALGLLAAGVVPASAQTGCRQIQIATIRTSGPMTVTPLDAIAFPVPLAPARSAVVRQILFCPPGTTLAPLIRRVPAVIRTPVFGAPIQTPIFVTPVFLGGSTVTTLPFVPAPPPYAAPAPGPAVVGTAPVDTVQDLATRSAAYDRMVVTVAGTVADVAQATDAHGTPITTFRLEAQGTSVGVLVWGHRALQAGEPVRVTGPFYVSTPFLGSSGKPWHNVVEVDALE